MEYKRLPKHIGIIPDGNRRWAVRNGLTKEKGYDHGLDAGFEVYKQCLELGIQEITYYGFTQDNTKRSKIQVRAFQKACVDSVFALKAHDANVLVVGDCDSPLFPKELLPYTKRTVLCNRQMKVNLLVNYGWEWDLNYLRNKGEKKSEIGADIGSSEISRMDLIIRWGGHRRLSGFLPVQSVYSDFYVVDALWPDFTPKHFNDALAWYQMQDVTLGG